MGSSNTRLLPNYNKNINVGVLGHVDSGKTRLVAALSTTLSTAAQDKNPQSKERGITLDLGFSSFAVPSRRVFPDIDTGYDKVQFTLVDCPGHASLVRTIVGGAHIIDMMILVVDVMKGIQAQTAECLFCIDARSRVISISFHMLVDLLPADKKDKYLKKATKLIKETLKATKFRDAPIIPVSAIEQEETSVVLKEQAEEKLDGNKIASRQEDFLSMSKYSGIDILIDTIVKSVPQEHALHRDTGPFMMYIDHCFAVKGQGTIITGTISSGTIAPGDTIEFPSLNLQKKVKSIQAFRKPVSSAFAGDRVGVCVANFSADLLERGVTCKPGTVKSFKEAIVSVEKVRFYPRKVPTNGKLHIILGHTTVMATLTFFGTPLMTSKQWVSVKDGFAFENDYLYQEELYGAEGRPVEEEKLHFGTLAHKLPEAFHGPQWAYVRFEDFVLGQEGTIFLGAKLDADLNTPTCRIALHGKILVPLTGGPDNLKVFRTKSRSGVIERVDADGKTAICRDMFNKNTNMKSFLGMTVHGPGWNMGRIESSFGQNGMCRICYPKGINSKQDGPVVLKYKKYMFDKSNSKVVHQ
eukprot:jgi/Picsp_1/1522/NSC_05000-R1_selenocysteine-specific elongation factor